MTKNKLQINPKEVALPPIPLSGISFVGCDFGSGKTVAMTGLAASLNDEGFAVEAKKPITYGNKTYVEAELGFISRISHTAKDYAINHINMPGDISSKQWKEIVNNHKHPEKFSFIELPGSAATPLCWTNNSLLPWKDTADLAFALGFPCILTAAYGPKYLEQIMLNANYLKHKKVEVAGIITVMTTAESHLFSYPETVDMAVSEQTGVKHLGIIPYSQSISVGNIMQGNLIRLTSGNLDLLPIVQMLELPLKAQAEENAAETDSSITIE